MYISVDIQHEAIMAAAAAINKKKGTCKILPEARFLCGNNDTKLEYFCLVCDQRMGGEQTGTSAIDCTNCIQKKAKKGKKPSKEGKATYIREVRVSYGEPTMQSFKADNPRAVAEFFRPMIKDEARECLLVMNLDCKFMVNSWRMVSVGIVSETLVHPREIFISATISNASAIIVAHNHPSGVVLPSEEDLNTTNRLKKAGDILGIELLDHIIIGPSDYYSCKEHGQI